MKKQTLIIVLILIVCNLSAQEKKPKDDIYFLKEKPKELSKFKSQDEQIIYCLEKYRNERLTGFGIGALGGIAIIAASNNKENQETFNYVAAGLGVVSLFVILDAEKWISKSKLTFTGNGLALRF